jgi:peroxiredoxin
VKAEATFLAYQDASYRENAVILRRFMNRGKVEPIPVDYFSFHTRAPVVNLSAQHLSIYWGFVSDCLFLQSDRPIGQPLDGIWMDKDFALADRLLPTKLAELRKLHSLSGMAKSDPVKAIVSIKKWAPSLPSKQLVKVIEADAEARINRLKPGDTAPNFFLPDLQDSLTTMKGFRENVVLLCFWFPGCKPCIAEFPHENKLVAAFENEPVKIVSICTLSSKESWQKAVKKYGLKTLNLYANTNWQKTLELKYAITGYPHYALIDKQGRIVKNFASRPSMNAQDEINALLK